MLLSSCHQQNPLDLDQDTDWADEWMVSELERFIQLTTIPFPTLELVRVYVI